MFANFFLVIGLAASVFGGRRTSVDIYSHHVSLQIKEEHICSGSLYNKEIVLTAAHCLDKIFPKDLTIRLGSTYWNRGGVVRTVRNFRKHQNYDAKIRQNDIAVIRLNEPVSYSFSVKNIPLPIVPINDKTVVVVTAWSNDQDFLQLQDSRIHANAMYYFHMLATVVGEGIHNADSGGPVIYAGFLYGIVSKPTGLKGKGSYVNVYQLKSWIVKTSDDI